jgi:AcrR family transcriptional regulator
MERATAPVAGYRERLIAALAESIDGQGYRDTTVADIVRIARTSRRSFYEQFADRDDCFLALFERTVEEMMAGVAGAVEPTDPPERQVDQALDAYLAAVLARPALHLSFVRDLPALGEAGAARQRAVVEHFAELLVTIVDAGRRAHPELDARPLDPDVAVMIVGGIRELMVTAAARGRDVRELRRSASRGAMAIIDATVLGGHTVPAMRPAPPYPGSTSRTSRRTGRDGR